MQFHFPLLPSLQERFSAAHSQLAEAIRPEYCHYFLPQQTPGHRRKEGQGQVWALQRLGVGQGGSCPHPGLAVPQACFTGNLVGPLSLPQLRYQGCPCVESTIPWVGVASCVVGRLTTPTFPFGTGPRKLLIRLSENDHAGMDS